MGADGRSEMYMAYGVVGLSFVSMGNTVAGLTGVKGRDQAIETAQKEQTLPKAHYASTN